MRTVLPQVGTLDLAGSEADHISVVIFRGVGGTPAPAVPLPNESAPVLDIEINSFPGNGESRLLIFLCRSSQKIHAVEVAGGGIDRLPFRDHRVRRARLCGSKLKFHIVKFNLSREHLRGQGVASAIESTRRL